MELPIRISVCKIDQFDRNNKIGFGSQEDYYEGKSTNKTYYNWMGLEGHLSANETIHQLFISGEELIKTGIGVKGTTTTVLPIGLCKHFEAIPGKLIRKGGLYKGVLSLYIKDIGSVYHVFVSDPAAAPKFQLPKSLITGDRIKADAVNQSKVYYYTVTLKETHVELDDGSCVDYPDAAGHESYADCVDKENQRKILPDLGCMPPWLSEKVPCNKPILRLTDDHRSVKWRIDSLYPRSKTGFSYESKSCLLPCIQISVKNVFQDVKRNRESKKKINLFFENVVNVERIGPAYGTVDLLVEVGSCLGLWLGLSVVGIFDILVLVLVKIKNIKKDIAPGQLQDQIVE